MFAILIPVYGVLCIAAMAAIAGDTAGFMERTANIHWGLLVCVVRPEPRTRASDARHPGIRGPERETSPVSDSDRRVERCASVHLGKLCGRRPIAPTVSPGKTVEGFLGGIATATLLGCALWPLTPFSPLQCAAMSFVATSVGFAGGLVMSAIKRDRGIKDFGATIAGHGGILDRVDSLCFAAPVFFHLTRYFYAM